MFKENKIAKEEFQNLKEENIMFITNPGRMGDISGFNLIIKHEREYITYRIDDCRQNSNDTNCISLEDMFKKFPKWKEMWENAYNEDYINDKYNYIYMGYGNGLSVDKSIYNEFNKYLVNEVKKHKSYNLSDGNNYKPALVYSTWINAVLKYTEDNNISIK